MRNKARREGIPLKAPYLRALICKAIYVLWTIIGNALSCNLQRDMATGALEWYESVVLLPTLNGGMKHSRSTSTRHIAGIRLQVMLWAWSMLIGQGFLASVSAAAHSCESMTGISSPIDAPMESMWANADSNSAGCEHCHHAGFTHCAGLHECGGLTALANGVVAPAFLMQSQVAVAALKVPPVVTLQLAPPLRPPPA